MSNYDKLNELHDTVINLDSVYSKWAKKFNITNNELCTLNILLKNQGQKITQRQICNQIGITFTTLNSSIKNLEEKKYIFCQINEANKKERHIFLTESGIQYAENIINPLMEIEKETADKIKLQDIEKAISCLKKYQELLVEHFDK